MADKQTDHDKATALREYRAQHEAAVDRMAALKAARLARDSGQPVAPAAKPAAKKKKKKR